VEEDVQIEQHFFFLISSEKKNITEQSTSKSNRPQHPCGL